MKYVKEIMWIIAFTFLGEFLSAVLPLPVPAGVYGLILLFLALLIGLVKLPDVEGAGNFLLDTMTMMFLPAAVGIMTVIHTLLPVLIPYVVIILVSTILAMVVSTFSNWLFGRLWTFRNAEKQNIWLEIGKVYAAAAVGILLNLLIMRILVGTVGIQDMVAKIIATIIVFAYNFLIRKLVIYRK